MKKILIYISIITIAILCIGGCGKKAQEESNEENIEADITEVEESQEEPQEESKESALKPVSEKGNPYNFDENYLGYYSNNYWGMDLKQIDGENLIVDVYEYGYLLSENNPYPILDSKTFNVYGDYTLSEFDVIFNDDGTFKLTEEQASNVNLGMMMTYTSDLSYISVAYGRYHDTNAEFFGTKTFSKSEDKPDGTKKIDISGYYDEHANTQTLTNRRDNEAYPKYIEYIPKYSTYICGDPNKDDYFWLLEINTRPLERDDYIWKDINNPYMFQARIAQISKNDNGFIVENISLQDLYNSFRMYSFGYSQTEFIGFRPYFEDSVSNPYPDIDYAYLTMDCTDSEKITVHTNIVESTAFVDGHLTTIKLDETSEFIPISTDEITNLNIQILHNGEYYKAWESWYNFDFSQVSVNN